MKLVHFELRPACAHHLNPVRAGLVAHADEYRWSSVRAYLGRGPRPDFLTVPARAEVLGHFGRQIRRARPRYAAPHPDRHSTIGWRKPSWATARGWRR